MHQLDPLGMPSDQQLETIEVLAAQTEQLHAQAVARHRLQQQRYDRVYRYHEMVDRRQKLSSEVQQAEAAIEHAPEIRAAAEMREKLRIVLPLVKSAYDELSQAAVAEEKAASARADSEMIDLDVLQGTVETTAVGLETASQAHENNAQKLRQCREELEQLQPQLELARRLNDLDVQVTGGGQRVASLVEQTATLGEVLVRKQSVDLLYRSLPSMQAYVEAREVVDELLAGRIPETLEAQLEQATSDVAVAAVALETFGRAVTARREAIAALNQRRVTVKEEREQREEAGGEGSCSRCGQPITLEHIEAELFRCTAELALIETDLASAETGLSVDDGELQAARSKCESATTLEERARDQLRRFIDRQAEIDRLEASPFMTELPDDCRKALRGSAHIAATALAGWEQEIGTLNRLSDELDRLRALDADRRSQEQLVATFEVDRSSLLEQISRDQAEVSLANSTELATEIHDREAEEVILAKGIRTQAQAMEEARTDHSKAELAKTRLEADARSSLVEAEARRKNAGQLIATVESQFRPPTAETIQLLEDRFGQLDDAEAKFAVLTSAESEVTRWRGQLAEAEDAIARIPETERIPLDVAATDLLAEQHAESEAETARDAARDALKEVLRLRDEHQERQSQAELVDRQRQVWQRVARLLGRSGLQLALLKRDLREIERRANPFLQRISGGSLSLWIECTEGRSNRRKSTSSVSIRPPPTTRST